MDSVHTLQHTKQLAGQFISNFLGLADCVLHKFSFIHSMLRHCSPLSTSAMYTLKKLHIFAHNSWCLVPMGLDRLNYPHLSLGKREHKCLGGLEFDII